MKNIIPYRKPEAATSPSANSNSSFEEHKNWISNIAAIAVGGAVAFLVPAITLKGVLLAGAAAVALISPYAAAGLVAVPGLELVSGFPLTQTLFMAAAFLATRWGLKTAISSGEEIVQTVKTSMKMAGKGITGLKYAANGASDLARSSLKSAGNFFFPARQLSAQPT